MEMNTANDAQHKFFRGEPSFVDKKMDEKSKFGQLCTGEIQEIEDSAVPVTTKKPQSSGWDYYISFTFPLKLQNFKYDRFNAFVNIT